MGFRGRVVGFIRIFPGFIGLKKPHSKKCLSPIKILSGISVTGIWKNL